MKAYSQFSASQMLEIFTKARKPDIVAVTKSDTKELLLGERYSNVMEYITEDSRDEKVFAFKFKTNSPFLNISVKAEDAVDALDILKDNIRYVENQFNGFVVEVLEDLDERNAV